MMAGIRMEAPRRSSSRMRARRGRPDCPGWRGILTSRKMAAKEAAPTGRLVDGGG